MSFFGLHRLTTYIFDSLERGLVLLSAIYTHNSIRNCTLVVSHGFGITDYFIGSISTR